MTRLTIAAGLALISVPISVPLSAQDHSGHDMALKPSADAQAEPAMDHCAMGHLPPEQCPPKDQEAAAQDMEHGEHASREAAEEAETDHSAHGAMDDGEMDHAAMGHGSHVGAPDKSAPGAAPEDAVPTRAFHGPRHAADSVWGAEAMASSRQQLARENGGMRTGMVLIERLEARVSAGGGEDGYLWDAQAFYGGDINRLVIKTEGEGELGGTVEDAELQALYSRAIGPFFDLQAGVRFDVEPDARSHLVVGVQGLSPYMFHVDGAMFLSDRGDLTARLEGEYDQRITQRLIIQPRMEVEFAGQDIPEREIGAGITKIEPGVRLRYEFVREFAPYIGIEYEAKVGETADIARSAGEDPTGLKLVIGLRAWF
mgnify:CR=1 FL=1